MENARVEAAGSTRSVVETKAYIRGKKAFWRQKVRRLPKDGECPYPSTHDAGAGFKAE